MVAVQAARIAPAALLVAAAAWFAYFAVYQVDDAFIVYRYAENLAAGVGFVFNPGERVEGVTCFSWTVLLALVASTGVPLPGVAPLLTAAAGLVLLWRLPSISAQLDGRSRPGLRDLIPPLLVAAHPSFAYWSVGALETVPYALLLVLSFECTLRDRRGAATMAAALAGLAALTRPEGLLLGGAIAVGYALRADGWRRWARRLIDWHLVVAAMLVPLLVFRRFYFGVWLPNTYYARTGGSFSGTVELGWAYTVGFLRSLAPWPGEPGVVGVALGGTLVVASVAYGLRRAKLRGAALICAALLAIVVLEGGDWMHLQRFQVPLLPFLALLVVAGVAALRGSLGSGAAVKPAWSAVAAVMLVTWVAVFVARGIEARNGPEGLLVDAEGHRHAHLAVAQYLEERALPGDSVALMDIGMIGYYSGLHIVDISGLTEPEIARAPGGFLTKSFSPAWLLNRRPRFVVLVPTFPIDTRIANDDEFRRRYRGVFRRDHRFNRTPPGGYYLTVFEEIPGLPGPR
jgi:hypothetical protein